MRFFLFVFFCCFFCLSVFGLSGPLVSSSSHPDSDKWYRDSSPVFEFGVDSALGYSFEFDLVSDTVPDTVSDSVEGKASFFNKSSGDWFFHVRARVSGEWTDVSHFRVRIDKVAPLAPLNVKAEPALDVLGVKLSWSEAEDKGGAGIVGYKIFRGLLLGFSVTDSATVVVSDLVSGTEFVDTGTTEGVYYHYKIQSVDAALNFGGISREVISRTFASCDFSLVFSKSLTSSFDFNIQSDGFVNGASLSVSLPGRVPELVFSNLSGKSFFSYSFDLDGVPQGGIVVDFFGRDNEGDECVLQETVFFDFVKPVVEWVFPLQKSVLKESVFLKTSVFDSGDGASGIELVEFFFDRQGLELLGVGVLENGEFVFDWNSLSVPNSRGDLVVRAVDAAGNLSEARLDVTIANTAIVSGEASSAILAAQEARVNALEVKRLLGSVGVVLVSFDSVFSFADSNLSSAVLAFEKGINFERAIFEASVARDLFFEAVQKVSVVKEKSFVLSFDADFFEKTVTMIGLRNDLVEAAVSNFLIFSPKRRIDFFRVVDGNSVFFKAVVGVLLDSDSNVFNARVVEVLPESFVLSFGVGSTGGFEVLNESVVLFDVNGESDLNAGFLGLYFVKRDFYAQEVLSFDAQKLNELFFVPPIVLPESVVVGSDVIVFPVDLFEEFNVWFSGFDLFSFVLVFGGGFLLVCFVLALVSFFVIVLIVWKNNKSGRRFGS